MNSRLLFALVVVAPGLARAQGSLPGSTVVATPRLRALVRSGDTTIVTYSVLVSSTSPDRLFGFTISVAAPVAVVVSPGSAAEWGAFKNFEGRQVAGWWSLHTTAPGDSTPSLVFKAIGVPGIATAWLTGYGATKPVADSLDAPAYDWLNDQSATTSAMGVYSAPFSQPTIAGYLQTQTDNACSLGWISSSALCTALHGFATNDYAAIQHYATSLDSARSAGSTVNDAAYWMLSINQSYAFAHTAPPPLSVYVTGDTATSIYTAHPSGGTSSYTYGWEWCAFDCGGGGDALRAPVRAQVVRPRPNSVESGWHDVGSTAASICWVMSESLLRVTVTDTNSSQAIAYFTVPLLAHVC